MSTDALDSLLLEETRAIRSVKRQILEALAGIAKGVSPEGIGQSLMKLLESIEHHVERLDRIVTRIKPAAGMDEGARPSIAQRVRGELERTLARARLGVPRGLARLTSREAEVLQLLAEGHVSQQIAAELGLSVSSVEKHRRRLMAKLGLYEADGVTRYAISAGIVEPV
jgi:DNA-binding NarL/FixJ family response regulator